MQTTQTIVLTCLTNDKVAHTRKEISRFSPPQTSIPGSYLPMAMKYWRSMANRPPAMVGVLQQVCSTGSGVEVQPVLSQSNPTLSSQNAIRRL